MIPQVNIFIKSDYESAFDFIIKIFKRKRVKADENAIEWDAFQHMIIFESGELSADCQQQKGRSCEGNMPIYGKTKRWRRLR